jgi:hypothetical protein
MFTMDPRAVKRDMLVGRVDIRVVEDELDLAGARRIADRIARDSLADPFLLAWFDRKIWRHSPPIC